MVEFSCVAIADGIWRDAGQASGSHKGEIVDMDAGMTLARFYAATYGLSKTPALSPLFVLYTLSPEVGTLFAVEAYEYYTIFENRKHSLS